MRKWLPALAFGLSTLWSVGSVDESGFSTTLIPNQIHPGDVFRLEVVRQNVEFAEFRLEVPHIDRLHLLGTEESPVELVNGTYLQKESWIFQADSSGDINLENLSAVFIHSDPELRIPLPAMKLSVVPYANEDTDNSPLALGSLSQNETSKRFGIYFVITLFLLIPASYIFIKYRRNTVSLSDDDSNPLLTQVLTELEQGNLNSDQLHQLLDSERTTLSSDLRKEIELALYANRGDPQSLADSLKKEVTR